MLSNINVSVGQPGSPGQSVVCLLFTTMFCCSLPPAPWSLIIFSKPPSAELCKHTHGCQLSLESNQTILGFPTTIRCDPCWCPTAPPPPGHDQTKQNQFWNLIFARSEVWRGACGPPSLSGVTQYLQFPLRGEERRATQSKCYCYCAGRLLSIIQLFCLLIIRQKKPNLSLLTTCYTTTGHSHRHGWMWNFSKTQKHLII